MIWNPFSKNKFEYTLGIDIGTSSIKIVELLHQGNTFSINNYAQFYAKANYITMQSGSLNILDSVVAKVLKAMFETAEFIGKKASVSLPIFSSFSTLIELPVMSDEDLEAAVKFEATKFIPVPIDEVQFDWIKVEHLSQDNKFKILTVAVQNDIIQKYNRIAEMAEISFINMELETFSVARALIKGEPNPVIILDIGARTTNVGIVDGGVVVMHHNIEKGSMSFTRVLARGMSIDGSRAEKLKKNDGLMLPGGQVAELLQPSIDKIILEIEQVVEDYIREGGKKAVRIFITGGGSRMPGLVEYLSKNLNIPTELGNPFRYIKSPPQIESILKDKAPEFAVAAGLALRE